LTAGRVSFQPVRYKYLIDWKGFLPAAGILWDTRIPASDLQKRGHPHPLAGIRNGYPPTISNIFDQSIHQYIQGALPINKHKFELNFINEF
jgi:hypothetical protein